MIFFMTVFDIFYFQNIYLKQSLLLHREKYVILVKLHLTAINIHNPINSNLAGNSWQPCPNTLTQFLQWLTHIAIGSNVMRI